jgi:tetratricopeptide (TPR) repeat protein
MKPESLVFAAAGTFFGLIAGWVIGSQQAVPQVPAPVTQAAPAPAAASTPQPQAPPPLDETEVQKYLALAESDPDNVTPRVRLGNIYFDAERYQDAITWYEAAMALDSTDPDVSTDLGVAYYYLNQPDKALQQFERSLEIDPRHTKTMLNMGIVRAFGKQDLEGAAKEWERVLSLAPESPEGQAAKRALDAMRSAHPTIDGGAASPGTN